MGTDRVLGVDACRAGWIGVALTAGQTTLYFGATIDALVLAAEADGPLAMIAIDIPIGLPDAGQRQADKLAYLAVGVLRSSVFITPTRRALDAPTHAAASALNRQLAGQGISVQAFALKPKIHQVDKWVRDRRHVIEVHPEVSFAQLAGAPLTVRKSTWAGTERRRGLLADAGITLGSDLGRPAEMAAVDDVLDAAVAAWTARRSARGEAQSRPDPPEVFSDGLHAAIWS